MLISERHYKGETWLDRLQMLSIKFSYLGVGAELASLSLIEAWGLYVYLNRLGNG